MKYANLVTHFFIAFTAVFGDYIVFKSCISESAILKAFSDTTVHGIIGFLSAAAFFSHEFNVSSQALAIHILICTLVSILIDADHFIVAKSFLLKDVTQTKHRGIFHCTSFWLLITLSLFGYSYLNKKIHVYTISWMLVLAFTSHHIRDGNRRGLWMYPFGHTPPIATWLYVLLSVTLPYLFALVYKYFKPEIYKYTMVDYVAV